MTPLLRVTDLSVGTTGYADRLLRSVSLDVGVGEALALVGESGAGKSMIARAVLGILPRSISVLGGQISLDGQDIAELAPVERRRLVGRSTALIPQDPMTALNPSRRIGSQISDRLIDILGWNRTEARLRTLEMLDVVGFAQPERSIRSYPHQLSGGMRQRALIASAFAANPRLVVADEPTTALDTTVQKRILGLIDRMRSRHGTGLLFISHDLGVVSKVCQRLVFSSCRPNYRGVGNAGFPLGPCTSLFVGLASGDPKFQRPGPVSLPGRAEGSADRGS